MVNLLRGKYDTVDQSEVLIVDCRFPYEYEGGHIQVTIQCSNIQRLLTVYHTMTTFDAPEGKKKALWKHCWKNENGGNLLSYEILI